MFRPGIYNTMKFPIPAAVGSALGAANFSDLTFQFLISSPGRVTGTYLFDNLRVNAVQIVTADAHTRPPAGYGGSVDLIATDAIPGLQSFSAAPVQVPDRFHLKLGTAGTSTAQLELGYEGTAAFTCAYNADPSDPTGKSFMLISCTNGAQSGDLVGASWARLTILNGAPIMKIRAQLAKNAVGDQTGGGIIPAMPTWWGDFEDCVPTPIANQALTYSASCKNQTDEANQIVNAYFTKVRNSNVLPNWIVTPVPEFARRRGDGTPNNNLTGPPPPNDPPFDHESHMNPGGDFDAYWRLNGNFTPTPYPGTDRNVADFDATFSTHAVLFGGDVNVLSINVKAHTDTGQTMPLPVLPPNSSGSVHVMLFGFEIPQLEGTADPNGGLSLNPPPISRDFNLPPIPVWIFTITIGATAEVGVSANLGWSATGFNAGVTPFASVGAHLEGSIDLGIASGGVDARISLLDVRTPVTAQATWFLNTAPNACSVIISASLNGQATISSGGGEVDLVASFLFYDTSFTLFKWDPLFSKTFPLFDIPIAFPAVPLPVALCTAPLTVVITAPSPGANLLAATPWPLQGSAVSTNGGGTIRDSDLHWSVSPLTAGDILSANTGRSVQATFSLPGTRTINLHAETTFNNPFGSIKEAGDAQVSITVTPLPAGDYIQKVITPCTGTTCGIGVGGTVYTLCNSSVSLSGETVTSCSNALAIQPAPVPGTYSISGLVSMPNADPASPPPTCTTWTATGPQTSSGPGPTTVLHASEIFETLTAQDGSVHPIGVLSIADWPVSSLGTYSITMTTTAGACGSGGSTVGSATVTVTLSPLR
ncbi:MAG TPA: hypothetical protein VKE70_20665 [Candidatus Solibacter sp.]|nr:hypothetical protein [Candidatus Solibacter sp.]